MKTSIKTLITSSLTAIVLTCSAFASAASAKEEVTLATSPTTPVRKIIVKGNVEVTLVQRENDGVNYAEDNIGEAKITQQGDILRITSTDHGAVKLIVYVNDIYRVDASENAVVKTRGSLRVRFLQLFVKGNAHVDISSVTQGLYTVMEDNSELKLSGSTDDHTVIMGETPKLTIDRFAALRTNMSSTAAKENEFVAFKK